MKSDVNLKRNSNIIQTQFKHNPDETKQFLNVYQNTYK